MTVEPDTLSTTFAALADPTRRAILARLAQGEATVTELAAPFDMSLPGISKHLRVLQRAGLIEQGRQAQWRPCRLSAGPLREVAGWVEQYRRHWEESFDRLGDYLRELQDARSRKGTTMTATRIDRGSTDTTADLLGRGRPRLRADLRRAARPRVAGVHGSRDRPALVGQARHHDDRRGDGRPTGWHWRYVSQDPVREDVAFYGEYLEIDPPRRFRWTFMFDVEGVGPMGGPETHTFEDVGGRTKVTSVAELGSVEALEGALESGMIEGGLELWDRLAELLVGG